MASSARYSPQCWSVWAVVLVVVVVSGTALALPPGKPMADFLTDYINTQQQMPPLSGPQEVAGWPYPELSLGQVSGVDVTPRREDLTPNYAVVVFHRGSQPWTEGKFTGEHVLPEGERQNVTEDAIVVLHPETGEVLESFGKNMFYVPHGLTVDKDFNIWLTDVGTHQVLRIPARGTEPDLILGEKFVPGDDDQHFCEPTHVAVASTGDFFVSDGYCNSRVLKFSKDGKVVGTIGKHLADKDAGADSPYKLSVPHSLALVEHLDLICVADRENERALCYNAGLKDNSTFGQFNRTLVPGGAVGRTFGLAYDPNDDVMHVAALLSQQPVFSHGYSYSPARAFTYSMDGEYLGGWGYILPSEAEQGPSVPHAIAVSPSGSDVYLADVMQHTVHKFTRMPDAQARADIRRVYFG